MRTAGAPSGGPPSGRGRGRRWRSRRGLAAVALATTVLASCSEAAPPLEPAPAERAHRAVLHLESPTTGDRALLIRIGGVRVDSVHAEDLDVFHARTAEDVERLLVVGEIRPGALLTLWIEDRDGGGAEARVEQAAARDTYEQRDVGGYRVVLVQR